MWIASTLGFFSIVKKQDGWHVRARQRRDIENLVRAAGICCPVHRWPEADYRFRIIVDCQGDLDRIFAALTATINYPNFKQAISGTPGQSEKLPVYEDLWLDLLGLQAQTRE